MAYAGLVSCSSITANGFGFVQCLPNCWGSADRETKNLDKADCLIYSANVSRGLCPKQETTCA